MLIFEIAFLVVAALMLVVDIIKTETADIEKVQEETEETKEINFAPQCRKVGTC